MRITNDLFYHYFLDERDSNRVASRLISKSAFYRLEIERDKKRKRERERKSNKVGKA
jgi:hypothetical protein